MSPAKIAMAVAVTMDAIAGTGSMKKVTGTSRAVAMVADRPGMAPTNIPKQAEPRMTASTCGWKTSSRAWAKTIIAPTSPLETENACGRERNEKQSAEGFLDHHGGRQAPRGPR